MFILNVAALDGYNLRHWIDASKVSYVLDYLRELSWCSNVRRDQIALDFSQVVMSYPSFFEKLTEELFSSGWGYYDVVRLFCQSIYSQGLNGEAVLSSIKWTAVDAIPSHPLRKDTAVYSKREDGLNTAQRIISVVNKGVPLHRIILHYHWQRGHALFNELFVDSLALTLIKNIDVNREVFLKFFRHNPKLSVYNYTLDGYAEKLYNQGVELPLWHKTGTFKEEE